MTSVQSPYRVVVTREHRSRPTNRTLHDEVIWIGSRNRFRPGKSSTASVMPDSRPNRVDNIRF